MHKPAAFSDLRGKTLTKVTPSETADEILFETSDGLKYRMCHFQDCCESVGINEIAGDLDDLIGREIKHVEESDVEQDNYLSTFYTLRTDAGTVQITWGANLDTYYSTNVDFVLVE
jgi:hypothetical protein